jgi:hypothetical protein
MMQHLIKHRINNIWKLADEPKGNMGSGRDPTLWFVTALAEALEVCLLALYLGLCILKLPT